MALILTMPVRSAAQSPAFVLSGVVLGGEQALVWLQEPTFTQNQPIVVRPGEMVGPYRLTTVQADRVELEGPGGKVMVPLYARLTTVPTGPISRPVAPRADGSAPAAAAGAAPAPMPPAQMEAFRENFIKALMGGQAAGAAGAAAPATTGTPQTRRGAPAPPTRSGGMPDLKKLFGGGDR
jgi:hypothetical protein